MRRSRRSRGRWRRRPEQVARADIVDLREAVAGLGERIANIEVAPVPVEDRELAEVERAVIALANRVSAVVRRSRRGTSFVLRRDRMPLPGGPSDKLGNEYERWWTASVMLDLLHTDEGLICVEAIGDDWDGVEFWADRSGKREGHQVKRQWGFRGAWTLAELKKRDVLKSLKKHLSQPDREAHFISRMGVEHLDELVERARASADAAAFKAHLGADSAIKALTTFKKHWGSATDADAFADLRRIHIDAIAPDVLGGLVRAQAALWFDEEPALVVGALGAVVLDNMGTALGPTQIWGGLKVHGMAPRPLKDVRALAHRIDVVRSRYLDAGSDIAGHRVARSIVGQVESDLAESRLVWVVGDAGTGKSEVVRDVVRKAAASKVALPFRLDRLTPASGAHEVGEQLGLPAGPVEALAVAAQGNDALLVVDQLDAVSVVSGRRAELLDAVLEIVSSARHHPNMRVLVACRQFDLDNDYRLKELDAAYKDARTRRVGGLEVAEIESLLSAIGVDAGLLDDTQRRLLALPLHLAIYADVVATGGAYNSFENPTQLFHEYVRRKRHAIEQRRVERNWFEVVDALLDQMSREEQLSTSWATLYRWEPFAEAMASEHVIVKDENRVAFFHETLFDYLFGLHFDPRLALADWLRGHEQGLFRRAQVRQLLTFRRHSRQAQYLQDLRDILLGKGVRFHLQRMVIAWLAQLPDPTDDEASVMLDFVTGPDWAKAQHGLQATRGSRAWFDRLRLHVPDLLDSPDDSLRKQTLWWLIPMATEAPNDVAALLEERLRADGWPPLLAWFVAWCRSFVHGSRLVDLVVALIDSGALDGRVGPTDLWANLRDKGSEPSYEGVLRVSVAVLRRNLATCEADAHLDLHDHWAPEVLAAVAEGAPVAFLDALTNVVVDACTREHWEAEPWNGDGLSWSSSVSGHDDVWASLATQLGVALAGALSAGDPKAKAVLDDLSRMDSISPQLVVANAYRRLAAQFADQAASWIVADDRRLDLRGPSPVDVRNIAEELIRVISPHCSEQSLRALEDKMLLHYTRWELTADGRTARGRAQWRLLSACPEARLSESAARRLQELRRKFGDAAPQPVRQMRAHAVGSPIDDAAAHRMDDEAWLGAMQKYRGEQTVWGDDGVPRGGARELAQQLQQHASRDPDRFLALARRIPEDWNPVYLGAILAGVTDSKLAAPELTPVILRAHDLPDRPLGWAILDCVQEHPEADWPADVLACVAWYAVSAPPPPPWPENERRHPSDPRGHADRVHTIGINSVQGRAAEAAGLLVHADGSRIAALSTAIDAVVAHPHPAVRSCAAVAVHGVLRHDSHRALVLAKRLLANPDVAVATRPIERLRYVILPAHTGELLDELAALVDSEDPEIAAVGARRVVLAALSDASAMPLARRCIRGSAVQRRAAATILSANVVAAPHRAFCEAELTPMFRDPDKGVRKAAAAWTRTVRRSEGADVADVKRLAMAFVASPAYLDDIDGLMMACEESNGDCAALIAAAAERFLDHVGRDAGDIQTHAAFTAHKLTTLILKAYAQAPRGSEVRRRCLDVIDQMYLNSVRDMDDAVAAADR